MGYLWFNNLWFPIKFYVVFSSKKLSHFLIRTFLLFFMLHVPEEHEAFMLVRFMGKSYINWLDSLWNTFKTNKNWAVCLNYILRKQKLSLAKRYSIPLLSIDLPKKLWFLF